MSYVSIAGLTAAMDQLLDLGEAKIETHARRLSEMLVERANKQGWQPFRDLSDGAASPHIIALMRPGKELKATQDALLRTKIVCSSRGGRIRVSLAPYNDESDIDSLLTALG
jgi:selenocysteine lyase/cysteine desulfurase